jgi:hypothetical protein
MEMSPISSKYALLIDEYRQIIGIADELVPSLFQLLVEHVQKDVAQYRRDRAPLQDPDPHWLQPAIDHNPSPQESTQQPQRGFILHSLCHQRHEHIWARLAACCTERWGL